MKVLKVESMGSQLKTEDPFIICMYHLDFYPKGLEDLSPASGLEDRRLGHDFSGQEGFSMYHGKSVPGFPMHPHRGFETVTVVLKGVVDHFDSKGSNGRYSNGDVQWLTTGKGCQHAEMFPLVNMNEDNPLELFQIWLNLPSKNKFVEPYYKMLWHEKIPSIEDDGTKIRLIAGKYHEYESIKPTPDSWAAEAENHLSIMIIELEKDACIKLPKVSNTLNRNIYFYNGEGVLNIDDVEILKGHRVKLNGNEDITVQNRGHVSKILLLEGEPINEEVIVYGPFVMNTEDEIRQAYTDYKETGFGGWPWKETDPTNGRSSDRFAKYSNGRIEKP